MKIIKVIITATVMRICLSDKKTVEKMALNSSQILAVCHNLPITALSNHS